MQHKRGCPIRAPTSVLDSTITFKGWATRLSQRDLMAMRQEITNQKLFRIVAIVIIGVNCAYAVHRELVLISGRTVVESFSYLTAVIYAGAAFVSWGYCKKLPKATDRLAAILFGVFCAFRIAMQFVSSVYLPPLNGISCAVILIGLIAMLVGVSRSSPAHEA
jgi:hypothetical protein